MQFKVPANTNADDEDRYEMVADDLPMDGLPDVNNVQLDDLEFYIDEDDDEEESRDQESRDREGVDFSEYMWMVDEEEFDRTEMERLEERALLEQCLKFVVLLNGERCPLYDQDGEITVIINDEADELHLENRL